jgi:hypothetical protein
MHEAAIEMFSELRMYKEAQRVAQETAGVDVNALFRKQAQWEQESGDKVRAPWLQYRMFPPLLSHVPAVAVACSRRCCRMFPPLLSHVPAVAVA